MGCYIRAMAMLFRQWITCTQGLHSWNLWATDWMRNNLHELPEAYTSTYNSGSRNVSPYISLCLWWSSSKTRMLDVWCYTGCRSCATYHRSPWNLGPGSSWLLDFFWWMRTAVTLGIHGYTGTAVMQIYRGSGAGGKCHVSSQQLQSPWIQNYQGFIVMSQWCHMGIVASQIINNLIVWGNNKKNIKVVHYLPLVRGIQWWLFGVIIILII